ncbi:MAG TPA: TetR/AcrR family transcriptional regulator [Sporichthyaceae bacterium]|nr:TetR/AcrR family transcriptional regulator [Sporichthyaceae bacterium]
MTTVAEAPERDRLLDAVEQLCYSRGVQAVGMDEIRAASGVSLKRIYQLYPGKEELVLAFLDRRDRRWRGSLEAYVDRRRAPHKRIEAVFDWLHQWFAEPDFRGCAWINAFGELSAASPRIVAAVRAHKEAFRDYLAGLVAAAGHPRTATAAIFLLAEGAMVTAAISGTPAPALQAKAAATALLTANRRG